jgi:hypothetical protein
LDQVQIKQAGDFSHKVEKIDDDLTTAKNILKKNTRKNQDKHLTVHLVPYSWNRVGSKKTIDQTYTGTGNKGFAHASVQTIFDTVFYQLAKDPTRRYTIIQVKFF